MKIRDIPGKRKKSSHKGDYGHVFVVAGSRGLTGAAALCANAALRAGAGLVTLGIPASLNLAMEAKLTEVMTLALPETGEGSLSLKAKRPILEKADECGAVALGPGLSVNPETARLVRKLIGEMKETAVLDADALNALVGRLDILKKTKQKCIVTPHPGEMSRLIRNSVAFVQGNRSAVAKRFADYYDAVVVLKGSGTVVADSGRQRRVYVNKSGNPGMATAGSGDVLTGVIAGFLAQGLKPFEAARLAAYVHGAAGDLAAKDKGEIGLIAGDILENIPYAIKELGDVKR